MTVATSPPNGHSSISVSWRRWTEFGRKPTFLLDALPEITAFGRGRQWQRVDAFGVDVDDAVLFLQPAPDEECGTRTHDPAVTSPTTPRTHDVDQTGLVLEVDERDALRGGRALSMGDNSGDEDLLAIL